MVLLQLFIVGVLGLICYQDMRYRAVYWVCFPALAVLLCVEKQANIGLVDTLIDAAYGALFLGFQLMLLWLYFAIKNKRSIDITKEHLGLGDILFLLSIIFYLSPVNYLMFYIGSLIIVLGYALVLQLGLNKADLQIPLAGIQAFLFGILYIVSITCSNLKLYTDFWIYGR